MIARVVSDERRSNWIGITAASAAHMFIIGGGYMSAPPLFHRMALEGVATPEQLSQAWALVSAGGAVAALAAGVMLRWLSARQTGLAFGALALVAIAMRGMLRDAPALRIDMFAFGIGAAGLLVVLTKQVADAAIERDKALSQGVFFSAYALGSAIGLIASEPLTVAVDAWRLAPLIWAGIGAATLGLWAVIVADARPTETRRSLDLTTPGARSLWMLCIVYGAYVGGYLGFAGAMPMLLREWGWSPSLADQALGVSTLAFIIGSLVLPAIADRLSQRKTVFVASMATSALATLALWSTAVQGAGLSSFVLLALIGGASGAMAIYFAILVTHPQIRGPNASFAIGMATTASYVGGALYPLLAAPLLTGAATGAGMLFAIGGFGVAGLAMLFVTEARKAPMPLQMS